MMKTTEKKVSEFQLRDRKASTGTEVDENLLNKRARILWRRYSECSERFDASLKPFVQKYFHERSNRPFFLSLNAVAPISLCHAFGVYDEKLVFEIGLAHLHLDHFTQVLDDSTDENDAPPEFLHLSHSLLMMGLAHYRNFLGHDEDGLRDIESQIEDVMRCERYLWSCKNEESVFNEDKLNELAGRGGIGECIGIALGSLTGDKAKTLEVNSALSATAKGIQLCDDLLDWQTDYEEGTNTWPISCSLQSLLERKVKPAPSTIAFEMVNFGAFEMVMQRALQELEIGANSFIAAGASTLGNSILGIMQSAKHLLSEVNLLRVDGTSDPQKLHIELQKLLKESDVRMQH